MGSYVDILKRISIHAPREGGDVFQASTLVTGETISIHAPREGGDRAGSQTGA